MGLDTTSYSKIEVFPADWEPPRDSEGEVDYDALWDSDIDQVRGADIFPRSVAGLDVEEGQFFRTHGAGPRTHSSYSGVHVYRHALANSSWSKKDSSTYSDYNGLDLLMDREDLPFWELIWHSDCDGVLSSEACQRLLKDFDKFNLALGDSPFDEYLLGHHDDWRRSLEHAADGGVIIYH